MPRADVIALFGPTGVGKTAVAIALAQRLRELRRGPGRGVGRRAAGLRRAWRSLTGAADAAERAQLEHRLISFLPVDATFSAGQYAELAHAEIDGLLAAGRRPIVVGGTGLYLRAALTELSLRPAAARGRPRALDGRARAPRAAGAARDPRASARRGRRAEIEPTDRQRIVRALELLDAGELEPPDGRVASCGPTTMRHPTLLVGLVMERERAVRADRRARRADDRRRRAERGAPRERRRRVDRPPARRSASRSCWPATSRR